MASVSSEVPVVPYRVRGDAAQDQHHLGQDGLGQGDAGGGVSGGAGGMGVHHRLNVGTQPIDQQVHGDFRRNLALALHGPPFGIDDDQVLLGHEALAHGGGCGQHVAVFQAYADVAVKGRHVAEPVDAPADLDNILAVLLQRLCHLS